MNDSDTALTRENLMRQMEASWNELLSYLESLTEEQLTRPTDAAGWTAKDHILHIAMWEAAEPAVLDRKSKREVMDIAPEIWKQGDDAINAEMRQRYHDMPLAEALRILRQNHANLVEKLNAMTDAELMLPYRHYQADSTDERPLLQWMFWNTIHHYRDHLPWIAALVGKA